MIVSDTAYYWFVSMFTGLSAGYWVVVDAYRLRVALSGDRTDLEVRDRIFGSSIGLMIGLVGVGGVLYYLITHHML